MTVEASKIIKGEGERTSTAAWVDRSPQSTTKFSIVAACKPSKLLVHGVFLVLALIFLNEVTHAFVRYREGKVGISTKEMKSKYVKFPSVTICLDLDTRKKAIGFKEIRPINETLQDIDFARHYSNGYALLIL